MLLGLDSIWESQRSTDPSSVWPLVCSAAGSHDRGSAWACCQLQTGVSVEVGEPLALAGRKSCDFCCRSLTRQESGGRRGPGQGSGWMGPSQSMLLLGSMDWQLESRGNYVCWWGTTAGAEHDGALQGGAGARHRRCQRTPFGVFLWGASCRP